MNPIVRNILAVLAGLIVGNLVNMGIVNMSGAFIPFPEGTDVNTIDGIKASFHLFEPKHFVFPFLAHALGTLAGAFVAARSAATNNKLIALGIGVFFLIGGIAMNLFMLPSPMWFTTLDLVVAYIPMGYLGWKLTGSRK